MQLSSLNNARDRYYSDDLNKEKVEASAIKEKLRELVQSGFDLKDMDAVVLRALYAPIKFFQTLDNVFNYGDFEFELEATGEDKDKFANRGEEELFDMAKNLFEARMYLSVFKASGGASADPNQFHANPDKPKDVDESFKGMFDIIDSLFRFTEEEIVPHLSQALREELNTCDDMAISFDIDARLPGKGAGLRYQLESSRLES